MGLWYIWRIGYDNRATCHEVRALRQGVFSNLLKPPSRLNIQVLTESRTYLPPSDRPVKDSGVAALAVELQSLVQCALSLNPRALQWSSAAVSWSPLKTKRCICCQSAAAWGPSAGTLFYQLQSVSQSACVSSLRRGFNRKSPWTVLIVNSSASFPI